ncbi:hypothetical protein NZA98_03340, partial [Escherichia coli]|nr:hypothetical protein [Escherichia coli]
DVLQIVFAGTTNGYKFLIAHDCHAVMGEELARWPESFPYLESLQQIARPHLGWNHHSHVDIHRASDRTKKEQILRAG